MNNKLRRYFTWLVKFTLSAALLGYLVATIETGKLLASLRSADPFLLALALILLFPNVGVQYLKWRMLAVRIDPAVSHREVFISLFAGFTFGIITPARIGEFGGRAYAFERMNKTLAVSLTAIDKSATLLMTVGFGSIGSAFFFSVFGYIEPGTATFLCSGILGILAMAVFGMTSRRFLAGLVHGISQRYPFLRRLIMSADALRLLNREDGRRLLLLSLAFYAVFVTQFVVLLAAFGALNPLISFAGVSAILFIKSVIPPVTFGELGIRESASVYVLSIAGLLHASAFNASMLLFCINIFIPAVIGVALLFFFPLHLRAPR